MPPAPRPPLSLDLTEALVARVYRHVPDTGLPVYADMTPMTEADRIAMAKQLLAQNDGRPFWIFGYGSLIWKPAFEYVETRRVMAHGWRRSFCIDLDSWRGTPEEPGLMLALVPGGSCAGMAYLMPPDDPEKRMLRLLEREVAFREDIRLVRWLTVRGPDGPIRALTFYAGMLGSGYFIDLPIKAQVHRLSRAVGHVGSCAEYLRNTVQHLEEIGIHDRYLWQLQSLVAAEISEHFPALAGELPTSSNAPR
ncbi:MAG: gamma-glutamylcyclotransferase [Cereibacter sphaeroides]|uniref:glutathione-specific gamma-glutamylcyclotransferase n=1 Tax=Cereibacter sphaeroides TaxID=1063 RepID=A0A2W5S4T3_CERSP|nr:MAG: gamma-glutamylcyclotransferase [Cereibacter sphaeroides]